MEKCRNYEHRQRSEELRITVADHRLIDVTDTPAMNRYVPRFPKDRHRFGVPKVTENNQKIKKFKLTEANFVKLFLTVHH